MPSTPTQAVTCRTLDCPNNGITITVPADGFPVTCGGCGTVLANPATN